VLGTVRRGRNAHLTSIRARFGDDERVYRFSWSGDQPVLESDDAALETSRFMSRSPIRFACELPLRRESGSPDVFVFYDIYTDQTFRLTLADGLLRVGGLVLPRIAAPR
jgi:hypothetical protein